MSEGREFDLGDVLSITTGHLVSRRHIDGVYDILGYMTGENLFTHQLPRAAGECAPVLLAAHPDLAGIVVPDLGSMEECGAWLDGLVPVYGATRMVQPLAAGVYEFKDPLAELAEMMQGKPIIVVELGES